MKTLDKPLAYFPVERVVESMALEKDIGIGPSGYHRHYYSDRNWQTYTPLLAQVVRYSRAGPILDLGAGCGYFVEAAVRWGLSSVGLEGSVDAVEMAKKRAPNIDIRLHRLSDALPFEACYFQTVVLNQVIEHMEPEVMRHTLQEAYRVLGSGGLLLVTSPSCFNKEELEADPTHINLLSPTQLSNILTQSGFDSIEAFDTPLPFLGRGRIGYGIARAIYKLLKIEWMSASANAIAHKPE